MIVVERISKCRRKFFFKGEKLSAQRFFKGETHPKFTILNVSRP